MKTQSFQRIINILSTAMVFISSLKRLSLPNNDYGQPEQRKTECNSDAVTFFLY